MSDFEAGGSGVSPGAGPCPVAHLDTGVELERGSES